MILSAYTLENGQVQYGSPEQVLRALDRATAQISRHGTGPKGKYEAILAVNRSGFGCEVQNDRTGVLTLTLNLRRTKPQGRELQGTTLRLPIE